MSWFADLPVQRKLGYAMLLTTTVALVLACGVFLAVEYVGYRRSIVHTVATLARVAADNSTAAIAFSDNASARQTLEALRAEPQIIGATLYDASGKVFARYNSRAEELLPDDPAASPGVRLERGYVIAVQPVVEGTRRLGTLYLQGTMEQIYARMRTYGLVVLSVLLSSFGLAGLLASFLRRTLARPILELAKTADAVSSQQDFSLRARQYGRDELGQMTATFNAMLEQTQSAVTGLRESEWAHRALVRALPTAAYMCDANGLITIFNDAATALWGREPEIGREFWCGSYKIFRPDGTPLPLDSCPMAVALREGRAVRGEEIVIERPDGTRRNVLPHPEPIRDTAGGLVGIVNMLVDITEQKRANAAANQLAAIVASSDDAIMSTDRDGIVTSWNSGAERLSGYAAAEMIGQSITHWIPSDQVAKELAILRRVQQGERMEHSETVRRRKDGSLVAVSRVCSALRDATGRVIGVSKILRDITERRRAEQQAAFLSNLAHDLSLLAEPTEIIRTASRAVGQHLLVDRCFFGLLGDESGSIVVAADWARDGFQSISGPHRAGDFGPPEFWQAMGKGPVMVASRATHPLTQNAGTSPESDRFGAHASVPFVREGRWISTLVVTVEGSRSWRTDELILLENILGRVWPMVERARGQQELRESERRQRDLLHALPVPCYLVDTQQRLLLFNAAAAVLWGRAPKLGETIRGSAIKMSDAEGVPIPAALSPVAIALRERRPVRGVEAWVVRPDGTRRWVVPHPDPIFDAQGNCTGAVDVVLDVTEERTAHERIQKVAERLNLAIASANLGDWTWDALTDLVTMSPRTCELYGVSPAASLTSGQLRDLLHEEDRERSRQALHAAIRNRNDYDIEYRVNRPDDTPRWLAAKGRSFYSANGEVRGMVGVVQDITERKQQAETLRALARKIESQARLFDATLSNLTDLAYAFDRDGRYIFANKPQLDLWGRRLDEVVGKNTFDLGFPPELAGRIQRQVQEVIATGQAVRGETLFTDASGKTDDHEYIFNPVLGLDGTVTAVVGSTRLITERKRAEEKLRQRESQLRLVTDNAPVLLVRVDRAHRFVFVNRAYAERNGYQPESVIGLKVADVVGAPAYELFRAALDTCLAGERVEFEVEAPYDRIGQRWIHVILVPEKEADGTITGLLGVISDIGARKQAENELKRARDEAIAASRAKDDFLAALSHELRTPLNPVLLLASDAASNVSLPAAIRADFELIRKNVDLEARLIDDLLDLTRIAHGKLQLDRRRCDVHAVIQDALTNVRPDLIEKGLQLRVDLAAPQSAVLGDSVRLQQVFWNILKNAVKFTPAGGCILVETRALGADRLEARVTDSGIGMTPREISRAFEAFTQGDHASNDTGIHRFGGLGLGLAITKMLVDLHAGRIRAQSAGRDRGSTFLIELPQFSAISTGEETSAAPAAAAPREVPTTPDQGDPVATRPVVRQRILLVEDHTPTRLTLQQLLRQRHFIVATAESAAKAHQLALGGDFDLIISDVGLPDRDGYELMTELHALNPRLAGIALSGYGMEEDLIRSRAAGFSAHLVKPITIGVLEAAIAGLPPVPAIETIPIPPRP